MSVPFVGLTGGIGAGKSTALGALERLGAAVLSTDVVVRELYASEEVRRAVEERFGTVEPGEIARRAFATDEDREWLEELLWPRVGERILEWRRTLPADTPAAIVEVPLLFESGMEAAFDATIAVVADEDVRAQRAGGRGHEALAQRTARQLSQPEKAARSTYVVENDGSEQELEARLSGILDMLKR